MPRHPSRIFPLCLAIVLTVLACPGFAVPPDPTPARTLRAGVETHSEPFTFADAQGRPAGFAVDLLKASARDQNLDVEFVVLPWNELLDAFKAGQLDIICNVVDTPERLSYIDFSATTMLMRGGLFTRNDSPPIATLADLSGRRVAVPRDSRAHDYLKHLDAQIAFVFVPTLQDCVDTVHDGRADVLFATEMVTEHLIRGRGYREIIPSPLQFPDFDYREHFGVRRGDAQLLARLNEGLLAIQRSGVYDQLYEKWLGPLQPRRLRWRDLQRYALPLVALFAAGLLILVWQRRMLRRLAEHAEALRQSEERLSLVLEGSQDGFWDWNVSADQITRSDRWSEMLGYAPGEIDGKRLSFLDLVHPDDRAPLLADEQAVWAGREHFAIEFRMKTKSGGWKWILDRGKVVARAPGTGTPLRLAGTHTDISARKDAEEETEKLQRKMLETQKLESLGVLAGGIAHDFNNLLTVILGNTALVRLDQGAGSPHAANLDKVLAASNRAADLCRQLLAYAGKGAFASEHLDLNELAKDTTHLLELSLSRAQLEFALAPALARIEGDPSQIRQVIMNLVLNASEALGENPGRIRVATRPIVLRDGELASALPSSDIPAGNYVCLEVSDTGCGMTAEVLARIFDPFYTTKFTGRGLGLAAVLGIVRTHRGALTVHSTPGRGSLFRIYLPAAAPAAVEPASSVPLAATRSAGTVLVADDEPTVRQLLSEVLRRLGYEAVVAGNGEEAVAVFRANPARFRVALLDLSMPLLDGAAALQQLRALRPDLPCILLSGHGEHDALSRIPAGEKAWFLQKPFTPDNLRTSLGQALQD
ncbi:MAG: transporter substrate-binding domain-containing protein [Opitutae bacterium]|nr:transporter substrate-binding domain-containing protein [Opitutae bacterium]